jgi:hypothetical protein
MIGDWDPFHRMGTYELSTSPCSVFITCVETVVVVLCYNSRAANINVFFVSVRNTQLNWNLHKLLVVDAVIANNVS